MRPIPDAALTLVKRWEGCELTAYPDPGSGGEPYTIGYGHTGGVKPGQTITEAQATKFLREDLGIAAERLWQRIGAIVDELTDNQYAALLSFVFNVGANPNWTIWKRLKARQFDQVPGELIKFVNASGKKMQGLVNRRTAEIRLWSTEEPGSEDVALASHVTRLVDTPPTATDPVKPAKSATVWGAVTAAVGGAFATVGNFLADIPDYAQTALNTIFPFAQKSELAQMVVNGVGGLAAVAGVLVAIQVVRKKNEARR
jgi:lysozyme